MWLWQQKSMQKRYLLWAKLLLISFSFHLIFFVWLFFLHYDSSFDIAITVDSRLFEQAGASVVFVPFKSKGTVCAGNAALPTQKLLPTIEQKTFIQQTKKNKRKVKEPKKQQINKPVAKQLSAKNRANKSMQQKKTHANQPKVKQRVSTKRKIKKQKKNVVALQNKRIKTQNKMVQNTIVDADAGKSSNQSLVQANHREIEAYRRQILLQEELAKCWKPPIGVPHDCVCQIKVVVNWNGIVKKFDVTKSSGVLMYDVAARSALHTMTMPSWSKGKSLTVTFKQ